uniref:Zinc finger protein 330 homolog n=2 Tax=Culex pipiens TaxID=7175 RepID=A0A8D8AK51_CULPI
MSKKIGQRKKAEKQKLRQKEIRNRDSQLLEQPSCDCQSVQRLPICSRQKCMLKTGTASSSTPECSPPECRWMRRKCLQSLACTCPLMDAVCVDCERGDLGITEGECTRIDSAIIFCVTTASVSKSKYATIQTKDLSMSVRSHKNGRKRLVQNTRRTAKRPITSWPTRIWTRRKRIRMMATRSKNPAMMKRATS